MMNNRSSLVTAIVVIAIALFVFAGFILLKYSRTTSDSVVDEAGMAPSETIRDGAYLALKSQTGMTVFAGGEDVKIMVYGDSDTIPVVGYDAIIRFDSEILSFVTADSLVEDFEIFTTDNGAVSITGIKKLDSTSTTELIDTPLVLLTFETLRGGAAQFSLDFTKGSTSDSNLVNTDNEDILQYVEGVAIVVGRALTLTQGESVQYDDMELTLDGTLVGSEECRDCIDSAGITVVQNGETRKLEFQVGGIAGLSETKQEAFGVMFELEQIREGEVDLRIGGISRG